MVHIRLCAHKASRHFNQLRNFLYIQISQFVSMYIKIVVENQTVASGMSFDNISMFFFIVWNAAYSIF